MSAGIIIPPNPLRRPLDRDYFLDDDSDEPGVRWSDFCTALQVWSWMKPGDERATVQHAADEFGVTCEVVRQAVQQNYWMLLLGPNDDPGKQSIDHDGE